MTVTQAIQDHDDVTVIVTRKGWTYRVERGSYTDDGEVATFEAYTRRFGERERVSMRVDEIATVVEGASQ